MATTVIDTAGWQVTVPLIAALNLTGSRLTAILAGQFGGAVAMLDSAAPAPGYDGAMQIDWSADPQTGLSDHIILTVTQDMRGAWRAAGPNGSPKTVTLFADVKRTVEGSDRDPEFVGRTSFSVSPGTDSAAIATSAGGFEAILAPIKTFQPVTAAAMIVGPQGPAHVPSGIDLVADEGQYFAMLVQDGRLVAVRIDPTGGTRGYVGALAGGGILSGALSVISQIALEGAIANRPGPLGGLRQDPGLYGDVPAAGRLLGSLTIGVPLAGQIGGGGGPSGGFGLTIPLAGSVNGAGGPAVALLSTSVPLVGLIDGSGAPSAALTTALAFAGAIPGAGGPVGRLTTAIALSGAIPGSGNPAGVLTTSIPLAGVISGAGALRGDLSTGVILAGQVPGSGSLSGALSLAIALAGAVPPASGPAGSITIVGAANLAGTIPAPSGPAGSLSTAPGLNARRARLMGALAA